MCSTIIIVAAKLPFTPSTVQTGHRFQRLLRGSEWLARYMDRRRPRYLVGAFIRTPARAPSKTRHWTAPSACVGHAGLRTAARQCGAFAWSSFNSALPGFQAAIDPTRRAARSSSMVTAVFRSLRPHERTALDSAITTFLQGAEADRGKYFYTFYSYLTQ